MKKKLKNIMEICFVLFYICLFLFFPFVSQFLLSSDSPVLTGEPTFTIVLDAGHGGIDSGVTAGNGIKESDVNLVFVKLLKDRFASVGAKVILTRENQGGLYGTATQGFKRRDMLKRKEIISTSSADVVLSIHMNKFSASARKGPQVFFQERDETSRILASTVQSVLNDFTGNAHSHLSGDFYILKCLPTRPCVIVECGFFSNPEEFALLTTPSYQRQLADVIFNGVMLYLYKT